VISSFYFCCLQLSTSTSTSVAAHSTRSRFRQALAQVFKNSGCDNSFF
jgi:hypothetical protein